MGFSVVLTGVAITLRNLGSSNGFLYRPNGINILLSNKSCLGLFSNDLGLSSGILRCGIDSTTCI